MKRFSFVLVIIGAFLILFSSCKKEEIAPDQDFGNYTKTITVTDESGKNAVTLLLGANEQWILNYLDEDNFKVIPIQENQSLASASADFFEKHPEFTEENDDIEKSATEGVTYSFTVKVMDKQKAEGVKGLGIYFKPPEITTDKGWSYMTYYSQPGIDHTFYIYRHSFWHRVYFGLQYKAYSNSPWSTTVSEWRKLKNNESYSKTYRVCYWMKARVKFRRKSDFTVEFEE